MLNFLGSECFGMYSSWVSKAHIQHRFQHFWTASHFAVSPKMENHRGWALFIIVTSPKRGDCNIRKEWVFCFVFCVFGFCVVPPKLPPYITFSTERCVWDLGYAVASQWVLDETLWIMCFGFCLTQSLSDSSQMMFTPTVFIQMTLKWHNQKCVCGEI